MRDRLTPSLFASNDLLLSLLACLLAASFLIAVVKKQEEIKPETERAAGNISVYVFWRDGIDADIDVHLLDPNREHTFYAHRAGRVWNLLRDDLGLPNDFTGRNFENAFARGLPPGEYVVNVQAYRSTPGLFPIQIDAELRIISSLKDNARLVYSRSVTLDHVSDEATLFRLLIVETGNMVPGSLSNEFLRFAGPGGTQ